MNVFLIHTTNINRNGIPVFMSFGTALTLEQLEAKLNENQLVRGMRLFTQFTRDDEGKCLKVVDQKPMLLGKSLITAIEIPEYRYVQFSEDAEA